MFSLAVGQILQDYDSDQMIGAYGFGASLPTPGMDMHCFPLTLQPKETEVHRVEGIMAAYSKCLPQVALSGPTLFTHIIEK